MRILFIFLMISLIGSSLYAQEGSMYLGGMAGINLIKKTDPSGGDTNSTSWNFSPEIGSWLSSDLQLGLSLEISHTDLGDLDNTVTNTFSPGVYIRKWKSVGEKFSIFAGANTAYNSSKFERFGEETKYVGFDAFLDFGAALTLGERWSILGRYATLRYYFQKNKDTNTKVSQLGFNVYALDNPFNIGVNYIFKQ